MEFVSLEEQLVGGVGGRGVELPYSFLSPFSGMSPNMTELLMTRTLSLNSINQSINQINIFLKLKSIKYSYPSI